MEVMRGGTPVAFKPITEDCYNEMLEVLPPKDWISRGFLVGEEWDTVRVDGGGVPGYTACLWFNGKYWESTVPLSRIEWRDLKGEDIHAMIMAYDAAAPAYKSPWYA